MTSVVNVNEKVQVPAKKENKVTAKDYILSYQEEFAKALPSVMTPERFTRIAISAIGQNDELAKSTPVSLIGALLACSQLGLEPNTPLGQAYLIPFKNTKKGVIECQMQLGYKGLIDLAYRSGEVESIMAECVYENDKFNFSLGLHPDIKHDQVLTNRGEIIAVYAVIKMKNGGYSFKVMSVEDINRHREKYSKATGFSPWQTAWEEMAKKTVLKAALKYAPMKSDFFRAVGQEEVTLNFDKKFEHIDEAFVPDEETRYPDAVEVAVEVVAENATTTEDGPSEELKNADPFTEAMADIEEKAKGKK